MPEICGPGRRRCASNIASISRIAPVFSSQGGILDSLSGDLPVFEYDRYPSWGEESGQPAYATRVAWSHRVFGQNFTLGAGGYYGRQYWGFGRDVDGWAGTTDLTLPLGKLFRLHRRSSTAAAPSAVWAEASDKAC